MQPGVHVRTSMSTNIWKRQESSWTERRTEERQKGNESKEKQEMTRLLNQKIFKTEVGSLQEELERLKAQRGSRLR